MSIIFLLKAWFMSLTHRFPQQTLTWNEHCYWFPTHCCYCAPSVSRRSFMLHSCNYSATRRSVWRTSKSVWLIKDCGFVAHFLCIQGDGLRYPTSAPIHRTDRCKFLITVADLIMLHQPPPVSWSGKSFSLCASLCTLYIVPHAESVNREGGELVFLVSVINWLLFVMHSGDKWHKSGCSFC